MGTWQLYRQSQTFGRPPSEIFGIRDNPWLAHQFDNAVLMFGTYVQNRLDARDADGKPKYRTFEAALGQPRQRVTVFNVAQFAAQPGVILKD